MSITRWLPVAAVLLGTSCSHHVTGHGSSQKPTVQISHPGTRVEYAETDGKPGYWIVESHGRRVRLPELPHVENSTCPGPDFTVSPDSEWIVADEKLWRGANEVWLIHRDAPLQYSLVFPSFSRAAWKFYEQKTGETYLDSEHYITRVKSWPSHGEPLRLTLYGGSVNKDREADVDVTLLFDLKSRTFSLPPENHQR